MTNEYRVSGLYSGGEAEINVEADDSEEARLKARPVLRSRGVRDDDPLVVGRKE